MKIHFIPTVIAAGLLSVSASHGATILTTDFEGLGNTDDNTLATSDYFPPTPTGWVPADQGYGANRQGANLVSTNNVWSFRYTNSGLTSAFEAIGALIAGSTYTITLDADMVVVLSMGKVGLSSRC